MIQLVIMACSILHGAQCRTITETYFTEPGSLPVFACARYGQHHASKWAMEHPNWRVHRFRCVPEGARRAAI